MDNEKKPEWLVVRGETSEEETLARLNWLADVRKIAVEGEREQWVEAAKKLASGLNETVAFPGPAAAKTYVREYYFQLLEADDYLSAAALSWRRAMFDPRPRHTRRIFADCRDYDLLLVIGAAGLGKTYGVAAWIVQDFIRDPRDTAVKFASVQQTNLEGNLWAKIRALLSMALFSPVSLDDFNDTKKSCRLPDSRPDCGMDAIFLGRASEAQGKLKGYHPEHFRPKTHPLFGDMTRVRIIIDEGQNTQEGVKEDFGSPRSSVGVHRCMKIIITANPTDASKWVLRLAEPQGGWTKESMEKIWGWDTAEGWHVCRVDASKFENVMEGRHVFLGMVEPDVQKQYLVNGIPTPGWYIFYKGWPPPGMSADVVVPAFWFDGSIGTPVFTGPTVGCAGVDPSFVNDPPFIAVGRYGTASGWIDAEGVEHHFESRKSADGREPRQCAVCDDLITLNPNSHTELAKDAVEWCRRLQIAPDHVVVDMTGNGYGVFTEMTRLFGQPVIGVNWKNSATDSKILTEDRHPANIQVVNVRSEMYWATRNWIQPRVHAFFVNPVCKQRAQLRHQFTTTTYNQIGGKQRIEDKEHWKSRNNGNSPNEADAVVQMVHAVRMRGHKLPALSDESAVENAAKARGESGGFYDSAGDAPADTCEASERMGGDVAWERPSLEGDEVRFG